MCSVQYPVDTQHLGFPELWLLTIFEEMVAWILKNFAESRRWITAFTTELASDGGDDSYFCEK